MSFYFMEIDRTVGRQEQSNIHSQLMEWGMLGTWEKELKDAIV